MLLLTIENLIDGLVIKRPSATCKTPYVADVKIEDKDENIMAHTAALGCCGPC